MRADIRPTQGGRGCGVLRLLAIYTLTSRKNLQMKNTVHALATVAAAASLAFGAHAATESGTADKPRVKIVATTFPVYDWT